MRLIMRCFLITWACLLPMSAAGAVVLQYHHVSADTPASTSVTPKEFRRHLDHLDDEGFRVLPLPELIEAVRGGLDPREKVAAITFDDGYANTWEHALPALEKKGWKATWFITTDKISEGDFTLSVEQLRKLRERGHTIANHTRTHPHMVRRRDGESRKAWLKRLRDEITGAQDQLENWLDEKPPRLLAYPYGESTPEIHELVDELGYTAFGQHTGALGEYTDWRQAPRVAINRRYAEWDKGLRNKVLSLPLPVRSADPADPVATEPRPELALELAGEWNKNQLNCFAAGQPAEITVEGGDDKTRVRVRARQDLGEGRQRYNCTASAGEGRFYWYSRQWMRKSASGWYPEP